MFDFWDVLKSLDLPGKLKPLLDSIESTDPRFVALLIIVLVYIGSKVVSGQPGLRTLGMRLAAVAALLFGGYAYYESRKVEAPDYLTITLKTFNAGGVVLALTWITLPVLNFVYNHLRLALAAFLGYSVYALVSSGTFELDSLPWIGARALIAVALTLVVAWILHPIWDFIKELLPKPATKPAPASEPVVVASAVVSQASPAAPAPVLPPAPALVSMPAPVVTAVQPPEPGLVRWQPRPAGDETPPAPETQRRRDKIRLKIELAYAMALPTISHRLPRPVFDDFVRRYLSDHLPPEDVEENGRQLEMLLQQHQQNEAEGVQPLEDLLRRLLDEQKRTQLMTLDHPSHHGTEGHGTKPPSPRDIARELQQNYGTPKDLMDN